MNKNTDDKAVVNVWQREVGQLSTRNFAHRLGASEDLIRRMCIYKKLEKHKGCVNTVSFNADGDIVISGSDDKRVILWDWETGNIKLSFHSGHTNNIFHARLMPYSNDRSIVTCGADGQVRHAQILESGKVETIFLAKHIGRAHRLDVVPGSPHIFLTCGEDALVQQIDLRSGTATRLFTCYTSGARRNFMPIVHLNTIAIDPRNPNLFAIGGIDEYARLYDIRKYRWDGSSDFGQAADNFCPPHLIGCGGVGITGLSFSDQSELLVSYNDEFIYLFDKDMGLGSNPVPLSPVSTSSNAGESSDNPLGIGDTENTGPQGYKGHQNSETVKGVSFCGPRCEYVMSGSDCGRIFIWKKKGGELIRVMQADKQVVNCIESHPHNMVLASSGIENDIKMWIPNSSDTAPPPIDIEQVRRPLQLSCFAFGDDGGESSDDDMYNDDDEEDSDDCIDNDGSDDYFDNGDFNVENDIIDDEDDEDDDDGDDSGDDDNIAEANDADNSFEVTFSS